MKTHITITIQGHSSESKYQLAKSIGQFLKTRGYGKVTISGLDDGDHLKGIIKTENVNIEIKPKLQDLAKNFSNELSHICEEL